MTKIKFTLLDRFAVLPKYQTKGAAGFDFHSIEDMVIPPGESRIVSTGLMCEVPSGYEMQIRPRSSMGKEGIIIPNSPGTIDSDYRGEIGVIPHNLTDMTYFVSVGQRIAQGIVCPAPQMVIMEVEEGELSETCRGSGGFGSTGS